MRDTLQSRDKDKTSCVIKIDGHVFANNEFIAVCYDGSEFNMMQNCDAVTLAVAAKMISDSYQECYSNLDEDDKKMVDEFVRGLHDEQN